MTQIITRAALTYPWLKIVPVADIDDPSTELSTLSGSTGGSLLIAFEAASGALDRATLYVWDESASSGTTPYSVAGNGGYWIAIGGSFIKGSVKTLDGNGAEISFYRTSDANQAAVMLGNGDGDIGGLTIGSSYDQSEIQELRNACETLADDVRALSTLIHAMRTSLINQGLMKGSA